MRCAPCLCMSDGCTTLTVMRSAAITVATTATAIDTVVRSTQQIVHIHNNGTASVWLGGQDVTAANGLTLPAGEYRAIPLMPGDQLWAIASGSSVEVRILFKAD